MTDNYGSSRGRLITLEAADVEALREALDGLGREVAELHESRKRLVRAADAERRAIERELHESVQQHLVGLAVNLQLASELAGTDPQAAATLLAEMKQDVQQALHETAQLAQRIYPPLLEAGGLASALRSAAASIGIVVSVEVEVGPDCPPEAVRTIYVCCLGALKHAGADARVTIKVRTEEKAIAFEVVEHGALSPAAAARSDAQLDPLRDRFEALGGRLTVRSEAGRVIRMSGSLPFSR